MPKKTLTVGDNHGDRLEVYYGFDEQFAARNNQAPYYSLTGSTWRNYREDCGGMLHDIIADRCRNWPELIQTMRWHLADNQGIPMHYIADSVYWWELATGKREPRPQDKPVDFFSQKIVLGAVAGDPRADVLAGWLHTHTKESITAWLEKRKAGLKSAMVADMAAAGVVVPE